MHMTGGEAVVRSLEANGVRAAFGIPGVHNLAIYDALLDSGIQHITARHEQGAAFMADGYARASGHVGVCLCTSGPALLNAATPLGTAYCDSSPVLCVASQIPTVGIGKEKGYIHECRDQLGCMRPVTAWAETAGTLESVPTVMHEAFRRLRTGRPRPVAIDVPCDILDSAGDVIIPDGAVAQPRRPDATAIAQAAELLANAQRPVIWAGGGVITSGAVDELLQLAERLQTPVCTTVLGKGAVPDDHPLCVGSCMVHPAAGEFLATFDVMLAVGTRFPQEETNDWTLPLPKTVIHVDVDPDELGRNVSPSLAVVGDARESLSVLNERLQSSASSERSAQLRGVSDLRQRILDDCRRLAPAGVELVVALQSALPRDAVLVSDLTLAAYWCRRLLGCYEPRTNIYPWGFCTLGFGVPAGIGAKVACPDKPVVVLSGDGGFLFNCQELATAVEAQAPIVVLLFNNNSYGVLKPQQQDRYGRTLATDLDNPDFVALAQSFGVEAARVTALEQLAPVVERAISSGKTWLIEVTAEIPLPVMEPGTRALHLRL